MNENNGLDSSVISGQFCDKNKEYQDTIWDILKKKETQYAVFICRLNVHCMHILLIQGVDTQGNFHLVLPSQKWVSFFEPSR